MLANLNQFLQVRVCVCMRICRRTCGHAHALIYEAMSCATSAEYRPQSALRWTISEPVRLYSSFVMHTSAKLPSGVMLC